MKKNRSTLLRHVVPRIPVSDLPVLAGYTLMGGLIAGCYGVVHDQVTFTLGPEYVHNYKFHQFASADAGFGDRVFVSCVGFLATWWLGAIVGWLLARRCIPDQPRPVARRQILLGFAVVFSSALLAGLLGCLYGLWRAPGADYSAWEETLARYEVAQPWLFMRVAYIHNAGYLGGFLGTILTFFTVRPAPSRQADGGTPMPGRRPHPEA